ncbi:MAG: phosphonate ABC transporter ATP-binding protein [Bdellovibrionaceae bacterium]|nr:phosphonate ABC transporter ATP-binding protein [Pseudobdellovibrionaceae bacterium]MBX3032489.1 phosphonate ABC transporter ATP-binding protein [Pseudobdellovibrionaceae bacterium]
MNGEHEVVTQPILSIRNLVKTYPNGVRALKGVTFDVQKGEFLVIIGLSGSGKSTLLRCINRLHDPTSGEILFQGEDLAKAQGDGIRRIRGRIGMIFQHFNLIPRHTVLSNVLMGRLGITSTWKSLFGLWKDDDKARALDYLRLVGIADKAKIRADQLSGGQQQRVAIARALTQNPDLLLADEPVASLDPATCHTVMDYLRKVNRELGITVVANLHFLSLVREYATRVIALKGGEIVYEGSPHNIDEAWFARIYGEGSKEVHIN